MSAPRPTSATCTGSAEPSPFGPTPSRTDILVVDDCAPNAELLEGMLGPEGYEARVAHDAAAALASIREAPPDVVDAQPVHALALKGRNHPVSAYAVHALR